jgi:hypothetical protein
LSVLVQQQTPPQQSCILQTLQVLGAEKSPARVRG